MSSAPAILFNNAMNTLSRVLNRNARASDAVYDKLQLQEQSDARLPDVQTTEVVVIPLSEETVPSSLDNGSNEAIVIPAGDNDGAGKRDGARYAVIIPATTLEAMVRRYALYFPQRGLGLLLLALSAFAFSLMTLFVSLTGGRVPSIELVFIRSFIQWFFAIIALGVQRQSLWGPPEKRFWITARGFVGIVSLSFFYTAILMMPLADASTLFFTSPIWTTILGYLVLGESCDVYDIGAALISIAGIIFVSRPTVIFGSDSTDSTVASASALVRTIGVILALCGAVVSSWVYITIRKVGKGTHPLVMVQYMGIIGMILTPISLSWETWVIPQGHDIAYCIFCGVAAFLGQIALNWGVQLENAGFANMIRNLDVVFAFIWQISIESQTPNVWSIVGSIIILSTVIALSVKKFHKQKHNNTTVATTKHVPIIELTVVSKSMDFVGDDNSMNADHIRLKQALNGITDEEAHGDDDDDDGNDDGIVGDDSQNDDLDDLYEDDYDDNIDDDNSDNRNNDK